MRAVMRLKNRPLSMAYNSWVEMREQGLFLRRLAMRTLNRDLNKGVRVRRRASFAHELVYSLPPLTALFFFFLYTHPFSPLSPAQWNSWMDYLDDWRSRRGRCA